MHLVKVILTYVLAFVLTMSIDAPASEASPVSDTTQCQLIQQALIIELHPKIMNVLRQRYHDNFLFSNAHVLPIQGADILEFEFVLEGTVMIGEQPETVQMTFRRDGLKGYTLDQVNVISKKRD